MKTGVQTPKYLSRAERLITDAGFPSIRTKTLSCKNSSFAVPGALPLPSQYPRATQFCGTLGSHERKWLGRPPGDNSVWCI